jgi:hypothetical protein
LVFPFFNIVKHVLLADLFVKPAALAAWLRPNRSQEQPKNLHHFFTATMGGGDRKRGDDHESTLPRQLARQTRVASAKNPRVMLCK